MLGRLFAEAIENAPTTAAVPAVVGAGGLGQLLAFPMSLCHMGKTATILGALLLLLAATVDALSFDARHMQTR